TTRSFSLLLLLAAACTEPSPELDAGRTPRPDARVLVDAAAIDAPRSETDGSCRIATDFSGMTYDAVNHQMLVFGGGHASTMTDAIQRLDLRDTLRWSDAYTPTPCASLVESNLDGDLGAWLTGTSGPYPRPVSAHTYDMVGYAPEQNELVVIGRAFTQGYCSEASNYIGGPSAHYGFDSEAWAFSAAATSAGISNTPKGTEREPPSTCFI